MSVPSLRELGSERLGRALLSALRTGAEWNERRSGRPEMDARALLDETSGLDADPDREATAEALERLLGSCEAEARLDALGRRIVAGECKRLLRVRAEVLTATARIGDERLGAVEAPVIVTGLPRSGTTFLHRLLSTAPGFTAPTFVETIDPVGALGADYPPPRVPRSIRRLERIAPRLRSIHSVDPSGPEECTFILQQTFRNGFFGAGLQIPSYLTWLLGQNMRPVYQYHRAVLRLLGTERSELRWVLKSPTHLLALPAIFEVYPRARVIHMHRDLADVMGSFCSLCETVRGLATSRVDPMEIGRDNRIMLKAFAFKGLSARQRLAPDRFLDVDYEELIADPRGTCVRVLAFVGADDPQQLAEAAVAAETVRRPSRRIHRYDLRRYGLTTEQVSADLSGYRRRLDAIRPA